MKLPKTAAISRWSFRGQAFALALGVSVASYFPVFLGKVPLPTEWLHLCSPWESLLVFHEPVPPHAEMGDLISLMYPFRAFLGQALSRGTLPYWNPHTFLGSPFLANPISATFYPPNGLFLLLPTRWAWSLQFPLRLGLAAFFASLLVRKIGASRAGALLGGLVFSLSGFMTGWQGWPQADCILWAPLILLCVLQIRRRPTPRRAALLALATAMPLLAGHPEVCLYTLGTAVAFGIFNLISALRRGRSTSWAFRYAGMLLLGAGLAAGLCAVQLIPSLEWSSLITRALDLPWLPFRARDVVALLSRDSRTNPSSVGLGIPEQCCYAGVCTLLLVPLAFLGRRRSVSLFFALLGIVAAEIAFGLFPASQLFRAIPRLQALPGNRLLGVLDLSLGVLAGLGLSGLQRKKSVRRFAAVSVLGVSALCLAVGIGALQSRLTGTARPNPWRSPASSGALLAASVATLATAASRKRPDMEPGMTFLVVLIVAADLLTFSRGHVPFVEAGTVFPEAPLFRFLEGHTLQHDRVLFLSGTAPANVEIMYGLNTVSGYPQVLRGTARLLSPLNGGSEHDEPLRPFRSEGVASANPRLLDLLGIRWVIATPYNEKPESRLRLQQRFPNYLANASLEVHENPTAIPIAFLVPIDGVRTRAPGAESTSESLPDGFDPRNSVILEPISRVTSDRGSPTSGEITALRQDINSVAGEMHGDATSVLVMTQTWYPGWRASLDGKETEVLRADGAFCAMVVPPGTHRFLFSFYPSHFPAAIAISSLSLCTAMVLLISRRRRLPAPVRGRPGSLPRSGMKETRNRGAGPRRRRAGP